MLFVANSNLIALLLGLLIGLIVAFWVFKARGKRPAETGTDETNPTETPLP
jgi:hypothetical protein